MIDGQGRTVLERACYAVELSADELWLRYFALGGTAMPADLSRYVEGTEEPDPVQYDTVIQAINERFMEMGRHERLPYRAEGA